MQISGWLAAPNRLAAAATTLGFSQTKTTEPTVSTENSGLQKTYNPWDTSRIPGGSSGGSAAVVAADEAIAALKMNPSSFRPRRGELVEVGMLKDSGQRRKTASGRSAVVWVVA